MSGKAQMGILDEMEEELKKKGAGMEMRGGGFLTVVGGIKDIADFFDETVVGYIVGIICQVIITIGVGIQKPLFMSKIVMNRIAIWIGVSTLELIPFLDWLPAGVIATGSMLYMSYKKVKDLKNIRGQVAELKSSLTKGK